MFSYDAVFPNEMRITRQTCLSAVDVLNRNFAEEHVDVLADLVHRHEVWFCRRKKIKSKKFMRDFREIYV